MSIEKIKVSRDINCELIRIISMLFIVASHYIGHSDLLQYLTNMTIEVLHNGHYPSFLTWKM